MREYFKSDIVARALPISDFTGFTVYFLLQDDEIVYVGYSACKYNRLQSHILDKTKEFNRVYFITDIDSYEEAIALENEYIKKFTPKYNISHNPVKTERVINHRVRVEPTPKINESKGKWTERFNKVAVIPDPPVPEPIKVDSPYELSDYPRVPANGYIKRGDFYHFKYKGVSYKTMDTEVTMGNKVFTFNSYFGKLI